MAEHRHIILRANPYVGKYGYPKLVRVKFKTPTRDRMPHATKLKADIELAQVDLRKNEGSDLIDGICLECWSDANYELKLESLEDRRAGIELREVRREDNRVFATIFIPQGELSSFVKKIEEYETKNTVAGKPKNAPLINSISGFRCPFVKSFFTDRMDCFPANNDNPIWWEVWLPFNHDPNDRSAAEMRRNAFAHDAAIAGIRIGEQVVAFPERLVLLAFASTRHWADSLRVLFQVAELRLAKEIATEFLSLPNSTQGEFVRDAAKRVQAPSSDAPAVCIIDTGLNRDHPLLLPLVELADVQAIHPGWSVADLHHHGTQMAGIAAYGEHLAQHLHSQDRLVFSHRLESVKILHHDPSQAHDPENYGAVTTEAVAMAEMQNPKRSRAICLAVTADDRDGAFPSSWSAAIDQHAAGALDDQRRLYVVAAGNVRNYSDPGYRYPEHNHQKYGIESPGQSWNALTVGAHTNFAYIQSHDYRGHQLVSPPGGLCPTSRTSVMWEERAWPLKPDIVMEGGNYARSPDGSISACDDMSLLTTTVRTGQLLDTMTDTSAATAQAARFAAILMAAYPYLWPETVRGLLVHSADWTPQMRRDFPGETKENIHKRLRCYGYGVPDLKKAMWTLNNQVALIYQGQLQPFKLEGAQDKTCDFHHHSLPWPKAVLESNWLQQATIRITLSYFIEPSPGRRGWNTKHRYASHGLRFALRGPTETEAEFRQRISKREWADDDEAQDPSVAEPQAWLLGPKLRTRGSLHSDSWTTTAADLAACGQVAIYPVTGWWRKRKHLGRIDRPARYSLIITISTPSTEVDLYTPILQQVELPVEVTV